MWNWEFRILACRLILMAGFGAEHPGSFFSRDCHGEVGTSNERRRHLEGIADVVVVPRDDRKQSPAVIVAKVRQSSGIVGQQPRGATEPRDRPFVSRSDR